MAQGGEMHPQGPWVRGQAMHGTQEMGMGSAQSPQVRWGQRGDTERQRMKEGRRQLEVPCKPGHKAMLAV